MDMHWCICKVNLSGQNFTIVEINETSPVSWPEVQVIFATHGEGNVYDIKPVKVGQQTARLEKDRLSAKYGADKVERVFPGRVFRMEMLMPGEEVDGLARVDREGVAIGHSNGDDEEDDDEINKTMPPPGSGPAVFKPGKMRPPGA